jgi:phage anti-repressor protein
MELKIIIIDSKEWISGRELEEQLGINQNFTSWIKNQIFRAFLNEGIDFKLLKVQSTGGRPGVDYLLSIEGAKRIAIISHTRESKRIIDYLLELDQKRNTLEHITVKEAAFAIRVINCLKYIDKQKECFTEHKNHYIEGRKDENYIYQEFAKYRSKIVGWDKDKIDNALNNFLIEHVGYNRTKLLTMSMFDKMSVMDIGEAIRIAVLDILYSKETDSKLAQNFSNLCKKLAEEMKIQPEKTNQKNLFRDKEVIEDVNKIELK